MRPQWHRRVKTFGFVVFALIALYAWINLSFSELRLDHERHCRIASDIHALGCQIDSYMTRNGNCPSSLAALEAVPMDPWNGEYIYRYPGTHNRNSFDLFFAGADRKADTADDDWGL